MSGGERCTQARMLEIAIVKQNILMSEMFKQQLITSKYLNIPQQSSTYVRYICFWLHLMKLNYWTGSPRLVTRKCLVHCLRMQQCCAESASKHQWCFIVIRYCSQACSVAAKATAFCTCMFIPKLWLCCHIFHQILVELHCHWAPLARFLFPAACPQQTANGTFLDHTMCKVWSVSILT